MARNKNSGSRLCFFPNSFRLNAGTRLGEDEVLCGEELVEDAAQNAVLRQVVVVHGLSSGALGPTTKHDFFFSSFSKEKHEIAN